MKGIFNTGPVKLMVLASSVETEKPQWLTLTKAVFLTLLVIALVTCGNNAELTVEQGIGPNPVLPAPEERLIPTVNIAPAIGWPEGRMPAPGAGLSVNAFASGLDHPRWLYVLPNGDVLVAETNASPEPMAEDSGGIRERVMNEVMERAGATVPSANRISLLRDVDGDGIAETRSVFVDQLLSPFGMALVGNDFYIANTNALLRFPYVDGQTEITAMGETITELPAWPIDHHWTKNVIASNDGKRLYVTVGSNSNIGENGMANEINRAAILEVNPETGDFVVFASGLRNPNGLDWHPQSGALWTTVNERDELGSDLVPDYLTSVQKDGFYGWPYSYYGQYLDERVTPQNPALVESALVPDYALGPHTASLGLAFNNSDLWPAKYVNGAFIGQHGSWNRDPLSGYKVIFVPFSGAEPDGMPDDILTGFVSDDGDAYGRPVGVIIDKQGALLVADDVGNTIWRVVPE